jgi:CubicO group peptidase (beta-lactamase class C family)
VASVNVTKCLRVTASVAFCAALAATSVCRADAQAGWADALAAYDHDTHDDLQGVVVMVDGRVVAERYYNAATADTLTDVRSAGKSITALLLGIAIDQGAIRSVDDRVSEYWPEAAGRATGEVRLRDLLTMRSGLDAFDDKPESPGNEDRMDESDDPHALALVVPRFEPSGTRYEYNSMAAYVAGLVVAKATGKKMADFAAEVLFEPLGVHHWRWQSDASGYTKGQGNLWITTRGFAALGEMVRNEGRARERQVVSAAFLRDALMPRFSIADGDPYADAYGYFWYSKTQLIDGARVDVSFASGNGGNKIYVVPSQRMVVAITSVAYGQGRGQRRSEEILRRILTVSLGAEGTASAWTPHRLHHMVRHAKRRSI